MERFKNDLLVARGMERDELIETARIYALLGQAEEVERRLSSVETLRRGATLSTKQIEQCRQVREEAYGRKLYNLLQSVKYSAKLLRERPFLLSYQGMVAKEMEGNIAHITTRLEQPLRISDETKVIFQGECFSALAEQLYYLAVAYAQRGEEAGMHHYLALSDQFYQEIGGKISTEIRTGLERLLQTAKVSFP